MLLKDLALNLYTLCHRVLHRASRVSRYGFFADTLRAETRDACVELLHSRGGFANSSPNAVLRRCISRLMPPLHILA